MYIPLVSKARELEGRFDRPPQPEACGSLTYRRGPTSTSRMRRLNGLRVRGAVQLSDGLDSHAAFHR